MEKERKDDRPQPWVSALLVIIVAAAVVLDNLYCMGVF